MMLYLIQKFGVYVAWLIGASFFFLRYLFTAGIVFMVFYIWKSKKFYSRKIQSRYPQTRQIYGELKHSLMTAGIFALLGVVLYFLRRNGHTFIYINIADYGWSYLILSFVFMVFLHDAYFYWTHRIMHHPRLFPVFHKVHHLSYNPTPLASFSFHPLEAVVEFGIVPLAALIIPLHPLVLLMLALWSLVWNIVGHLGFELFPADFVRHPVFQWFNTSTHHNIHHQRSKCNYGLYFTIWDRIMHTNHPDYLKIFDTIQSKITTNHEKASSCKISQ